MAFLSNLRISHKISALMFGLIFGFIAIGVTYYVQINMDTQVRASEQRTFEFQNKITQMNLKQVQMQALGRQLLSSGRDADWQDHEELRLAVSDGLRSVLADSREFGSAEQVTKIAALLDEYDEALRSARKTMSQPVKTPAAENAYPADAESTSPATPVIRLEPELTTAQLYALENAIAESFAAALSASGAAADAVFTEGATRKKTLQGMVTAIIFMVAMGTAVGIYLIYKSIVFPMVHIQSVIRRINRGNSSSRVRLQSQDEMGDLGKAFNKLFDERIQQLEVQSLENERLNNSIISLIESLGLIARRDLTIKVPVSPDITGTVSDAVNLLTTETAKTLRQVRAVSEEVNTVSDHLRNQSEQVIQFADGERKQVLATSKALDMLARAMNEVARRAEDTSQTAGEVIDNTQSARQIVEETVEGIRKIRETIAETEKRTKRLGDRSQEVSGIVSLINTIAERTHILALNASMHAASAGEAGKGFAVVADEVQRLAESARQSTDEIAAMVNNMRVETADTVSIMNTLISQVAEGSRRAEQAGQQMTTTERATRKLVDDVRYISEQAVQQAEIATRVRDRSNLIRDFTEKTGLQLQEQRQQTERLKRCAETLVDRVQLFKLPEDSGGMPEEPEKIARPALPAIQAAV